MPRDERTYITVHDGMPDHPKVEGLSDAAFRLMVETWCWSSRNRTDGKVVVTSWRKRGSARARAELVAAGLIETVEGGVIVHDYTEHQRTAAEIDELKQKRREAGSKGGKAKASATAGAKASASHVAKQTASKDVAESETDTEELDKSSSERPRKRATRLPDDWRPTETDVEWQRAKGISDLLARRSFEKFGNYWRAKSGKDSTKLDWSATWRNWLLTEQDRQPGTATRSDRPPGWEFGGA